MKTIYAIIDTVAGDITGLRMYSLMVFRTDAEAARYFADAINDKSSILNKHPDDYVLVRCGILHDTGKIEGDPSPTLVVKGSTLVARDTEPGDDLPGITK